MKRGPNKRSLSTVGKMMNDISSSSKLRKGAWSREEDILLKQCVQRYGEGKWHLVPSRAALNRCRKSCRLRWMNYLNPDIKRGEFMEDEVDLILRLHKLLGNRWSLIAGRIPARTANDIKNYWNTHLRKKIINEHLENDMINHDHKDTIISNSNAILKPRPWKFPKHDPIDDNRNHFAMDNNSNIINNSNNIVDDVVNNIPPEDKNHLISDSSFNWWDFSSELFDDGITIFPEVISNVSVENEYEEVNLPSETLLGDKFNFPNDFADDLDLWISKFESI